MLFLIAAIVAISASGANLHVRRPSSSECETVANRKAIEPMRKLVLAVILVLLTLPVHAATPDWNKRLTAAMPLLGHRNWILVVDSAYPLQTASGVETIETNATQLEVARAVLSEVENSIQVRPIVYMDAELPFISDSDAPGASAYRGQMAELLRKYPVQSQRHEKLISDIDEAGKTFHVLVLKTNMTIPYTSLFILLDCKYWSADQEKNLRIKMADAPLK